MNIYGYLSFWRIDIHYITLLCMAVLYVVYYRRIGNINNKLLRLGLPLLYCLGAAMHYEIFWNAGWALTWGVVILDVIGFIVCESVIWMAIRDLKHKFGYDIPQIDLDRWVYASWYFAAAILWLARTDFYLLYKQVHLHLTWLYPQIYIWEFVKLGTLFFFWLTPCCIIFLSGFTL